MAAGRHDVLTSGRRDMTRKPKAVLPAPSPPFRKPANPPSASTSSAPWRNPVGTSPAPPALSVWNAPTSTSASVPSALPVENSKLRTLAIIDAVIFPLLLLAASQSLHAQTAENVLLVVNRNDPVSVQIGDYYRERRAIPPGNVCSIDTFLYEEISWQMYVDGVERPIGACLTRSE